MKKKLMPEDKEILRQFNELHLHGDPDDVKTIMLHPFVEMAGTELAEKVKEIRDRIRP